MTEDALALDESRFAVGRSFSLPLQIRFRVRFNGITFKAKSLKRSMCIVQCTIEFLFTCREDGCLALFGL
ncbi:hypothetical protein ABW54_24965 [Burkholderia cenocepacia]|nr:hypothetical protein ABW54_24965 [Burkholderia cenocepacia]